LSLGLDLKFLACG